MNTEKRISAMVFDGFLERYVRMSGTPLYWEDSADADDWGLLVDVEVCNSATVTIGDGR